MDRSTPLENDAGREPAFFYVPLLASLCGVAFGSVYTPEPRGLLLLAVFSVIVIMYGCISSVRRGVLLGLCLLGILLGLWRIGSIERQFVEDSLQASVNEDVLLTGIIVREPDTRDTSRFLTIRVADTLLRVRVPLYPPFQYGETVSIEGKLVIPESFATDLGRIFPYAQYLRARGVYYEVRNAVVTPLAPAVPSISSTLYDAKQQFIERVYRAVPEPAAGLGLGMLLGMKQGLGERLTEVFQTTGLIHVVVLSGYNIMLVVSFVMLCLSLVRQRYLKFVFALVCIIGFGLLVGPSPTVVRASIMAGILLLAYASYRQYLVLRALVVAAVVMVLHSPLILLYDPGFQLSCMATLGLIVLMPRFPTFFASSRLALGMQQFLYATVATQIAVMPLLAYHIGQISLIAIVANALVLPLVPLGMALTALTGLSAVVPVISSFAAAGATLVLSSIVYCAEVLARVPFAAVVLPHIPWWVVLVAYSVIGVFVYRLYQRSPRQFHVGDLGATTLPVVMADVSKGTEKVKPPS